MDFRQPIKPLGWFHKCLDGIPNPRINWFYSCICTYTNNFLHLNSYNSQQCHLKHQDHRNLASPRKELECNRLDLLTSIVFNR